MSTPHKSKWLPHTNMEQPRHNEKANTLKCQAHGGEGAGESD